MIQSLVRNWWLVALRGLIALILGIFLLAMPLVGVAFLVIFIGVYPQPVIKGIRKAAVSEGLKTYDYNSEPAAARRVRPGGPAGPGGPGGPGAGEIDR